MKTNTRKPQPLGYGNTVNAVAFRASLIQFLDDAGKNYTNEEVKKLDDDEIAQIMKEQLEKAISDNFDSGKYIVVAIVHNRDSAASDSSLPSEQIHAHVIVKLRDRYKREHISTIQKKLGIKFLKDDPLFFNGGCEGVGVSWKRYACYMMHQTLSQADKHQYEASDCISNLTAGEIQHICNNDRIQEIDCSIDTNNAEEKYVSDLGNAYREFLFAYYRSGDLALADRIRIKAERKAKYDYKHATQKAQDRQTPKP